MNKMTLAMIPVMGLSMFASSAAITQAASPSAEQVAQHQENFFQKEADILGLTLDEVKNAWAQGTRILDLASQHGITKEALQAKIQAWAKAHRDERLQTLVSQGVITQAQADARKTAMDNREADGHGVKHPIRRFFHGRK